MKLFSRKPKDGRSIFPEVKHRIEWAFRVGDTDYYQFTDVFSLPYERALMAVAVYNELDMRCTREYLIKHVAATAELLRKQEIDVFKINMLNDQLKVRLGLKTETEILYRIASVVFFDKTENPVLYDQAYCEQKIAHWKSHKGVADFFLQQPLMELIPYLQNVDVNLDTFSPLVDAMNSLHGEKIQSITSEGEPNNSKTGKT